MMPQNLTSAGFTIAARTAGMPAVASVDRSPQPGGVYRLQPGIYVQKGVPCDAAPNAAIRRYDGRSISDAHSRACRARVLVRKRKSYTVSQSCINAGAEPAIRVVQRQTVKVTEALSFSVRPRGLGTAYRYCPASMLSTDLRGAGK